VMFPEILKYPKYEVVAGERRDGRRRDQKRRIRAEARPYDSKSGVLAALEEV